MDNKWLQSETMMLLVLSKYDGYGHPFYEDLVPVLHVNLFTVTQKAGIPLTWLGWESALSAFIYLDSYLNR